MTQAFSISSRQKQAVGRVGVLMGGDSSERDVSLRSGAAVTQALGRLGVDFVTIDTSETDIAEIASLDIDRAFIALHGRGGEDGTVQGALTAMGIPYTGCTVLASALGMDKLRCKMIWGQIGLPTPSYRLLDSTSDCAKVLETLGGKVVVKPVREGSSVGVAIAETASELRQAYGDASRYDSKVMAEQWIAGREFTVAILGSQALPVVETATDHVFYDYEAKYHSDSTRYYCPADLTPDATERIQSIALNAFNAIDGEGWGRVDFMADQNGEFYLLEANTVPGLTDHSLVPMSAAAAGIGFDELIFRILALTVESGSEVDTT